jgi:putative ABC transport system ATP-binding protein
MHKPQGCFGGQEILSAQGMQVRMGPLPEDRLLFSDLDLSLNPQEIVDLTGPSGSGKTTLLCALARMHPYAQGVLSLEGIDSSEFTPQHWRSHVALLPQKAAFVSGTVKDNFLFAYRFADKEQVSKPSDETMRLILARVGLCDIELGHDIDHLSVGQAARVALCRTLLTSPDVLLLDEVDAALDTASVKKISELISQYVQEEYRCCIRIRHREHDEYTTRHLVFAQGFLTEETL